MELETSTALRTHIVLKERQIQRKKEDMKLWDKKYIEITSVFKEMLDAKLSHLESVEPGYKKLRQCQIAEKKAKVELKKLKGTNEIRHKRLSIFYEIQRIKLNAAFVSFTMAIMCLKENRTLSSKLKSAAKKRREIVQNIFEVQEALKKHNDAKTKQPELKVSPCTSARPANSAEINTNIYKKGSRAMETTPVEMNRRKILENKVRNVYAMCKNAKDLTAGTGTKNLPATTSNRSLLKTPIPSKKIKIISDIKVRDAQPTTVLNKNDSSSNLLSRSFDSLCMNKSATTYQSSNQTDFPAETVKTSNRRSKKQTIAEKINISRVTLMKIRSVEELIREMPKTTNATQATTFESPKNLKSTTQSPQETRVVTLMKKAGILNINNPIVSSNLSQKSLPIFKGKRSKRKTFLDCEKRNPVTAKKDQNVRFADPIESHSLLHDDSDSQEASDDDYPACPIPVFRFTSDSIGQDSQDGKGAFSFGNYKPSSDTSDF